MAPIWYSLWVNWSGLENFIAILVTQIAQKMSDIFTQFDRYFELSYLTKFDQDMSLFAQQYNMYAR